MVASVMTSNQDDQIHNHTPSPSSVPLQSSSLPKTNILSPNENDVVAGRGSGANRHVGNAKFRDLVKRNKSLYMRLSKHEKMSVAREIYEIISNHRDPPGRFLQKNPETFLWFEIGKARALEKISQALREKVPASSATQRTQLSNSYNNTLEHSGYPNNVNLQQPTSLPSPPELPSSWRNNERHHCSSSWNRNNIHTNDGATGSQTIGIMTCHSSPARFLASGNISVPQKRPYSILGINQGDHSSSIMRIPSVPTQQETNIHIKNMSVLRESRRRSLESTNGKDIYPHPTSATPFLMKDAAITPQDIISTCGSHQNQQRRHLHPLHPQSHSMIPIKDENNWQISTNSSSSCSSSSNGGGGGVDNKTPLATQSTLRQHVLLPRAPPLPPVNTNMDPFSHHHSTAIDHQRFSGTRTSPHDNHHRRIYKDHIPNLHPIAGRGTRKAPSPDTLRSYHSQNAMPRGNNPMEQEAYNHNPCTHGVGQRYDNVAYRSSSASFTTTHPQDNLRGNWNETSSTSPNIRRQGPQKVIHKETRQSAARKLSNTTPSPSSPRKEQPHIIKGDTKEFEEDLIVPNFKRQKLSPSSTINDNSKESYEVNIRTDDTSTCSANIAKNKSHQKEGTSFTADEILAEVEEKDQSIIGRSCATSGRTQDELKDTCDKDSSFESERNVKGKGMPEHDRGNKDDKSRRSNSDTCKATTDRQLQQEKHDHDMNTATTNSQPDLCTKIISSTLSSKENSPLDEGKIPGNHDDSDQNKKSLYPTSSGLEALSTAASMVTRCRE